VAEDGIPDEQIDPVATAEKGATVAAVDEPPHAAGAVPPEIPHRGGNSYAGNALGGHEAGGVRGVVEEAEHGRCSMKCAQAAEETRVPDEAVPALADEGGAGEGGCQRREADEDQGEEIIVV